MGKETKPPELDLNRTISSLSSTVSDQPGTTAGTPKTPRPKSQRRPSAVTFLPPPSKKDDTVVQVGRVGDGTIGRPPKIQIEKTTPGGHNSILAPK